MFTATKLLESYSSTTLFLIWMWTSFLLSTLFSNEVLMKLLFKPQLIINSVDDANRNEITALVWKTLNQAFKIEAPIKREEPIGFHDYFNPKSYVDKLINEKYIIELREDFAIFIRDYFTSRYSIPFYVSLPSTKRVTGFPVRKGLDRRIKAKLDQL